MLIDVSGLGLPAVLFPEREVRKKASLVKDSDRFQPALKLPPKARAGWLAGSETRYVPVAFHLSGNISLKLSQTFESFRAQLTCVL